MKCEIDESNNKKKKRKKMQNKSKWEERVIKIIYWRGADQRRSRRMRPGHLRHKILSYLRAEGRPARRGFIEHKERLANETGIEQGARQIFPHRRSCNFNGSKINIYIYTEYEWLYSSRNGISIGSCCAVAASCTTAIRARKIRVSWTVS